MKFFSTAVLATAVSAGTKNRRGAENPKGSLNCASANGPSQTPHGPDSRVFYGKYNKKNFDTCIFSKLLGFGTLGRDQMRRAISFIDDKQIQTYAEKKWSKIIKDWRVLTGLDSVPGYDGNKIDCGFKPVHPSDVNWAEGYISQCGLMCAGLERINDADSSKKAIMALLNGYVTIINDQFSKPDQIEDPSKIRCWYNHLQIGYLDREGRMGDGWVNFWGDTCRHQDKCGQIIRNAYRDVAEFEAILGEQIPSLTDRTFEGDFNLVTGKEDDGSFVDHFKTGIFGIDKYIIRPEVKKAFRDKLWE